MLVAFGFGIVAFIGQLAYATVIGTVTSGGRPSGGPGLRTGRQRRWGCR